MEPRTLNDLVVYIEDVLLQWRTLNSLEECVPCEDEIDEAEFLKLLQTT